MIHTMHPFGLPGECRGKGSNVNFAGLNDNYIKSFNIKIF